MSDTGNSINPDDFKDSVWQPQLDESSGCYYFTNSMTRETTWINPRESDFKTRRAEEKVATALYYKSTIETKEEPAKTVEVGDGIFLFLMFV
jgi:hypothetical protein